MRFANYGEFERSEESMCQDLKEGPFSNETLSYGMCIFFNDELVVRSF